MSDWTADDLLAGGTTEITEERMARMHQAMAEPVTVSLVVKGKNGETVTWNINGHERTRLALTREYEQEQPPEPPWYDSYVGEVWAPRWRRTVWTVTTHFDYRPEDFQGHRR